MLSIGDLTMDEGVGDYRVEYYSADGLVTMTESAESLGHAKQLAEANCSCADVASWLVMRCVMSSVEVAVW